MGVDFGVATKVGEPLDEIVMNLGAWRRIADDEPFAGKVAQSSSCLSQSG